MPLDAEEMIQLLLKTNKEQEQTITDLMHTLGSDPGKKR